MTTVEKIVNSGSAVRPKRFRVDEFRKMTEAGILPEESGWEIIDGYLIDKMTIGSRHAGTLNRLTQILVRLLGERAVVSVQNPVSVDDYNEPEPDVSVLRPRGDFYASAHPRPHDVLFLIEVSDSTIAFDRDVKLNLYAESGVREVWLANLVDNVVERYSLPESGRYGEVRTYHRGEVVPSMTVEGLEIAVADILGD